MTDAELKELKAGLFGVTPGPWMLEIETSEHVDESEEDRQPEVYVCSSDTCCDYTVVATMGRAEAISHDRKSRDAAHIARCSPEAIRSLIARVEEAEGGWRDIASAPAKGEFLAERQTTGDWLKVQRNPLYPGHGAVVHAITGLMWSPKRWRPLPPSPPES